MYGRSRFHQILSPIDMTPLIEWDRRTQKFKANAMPCNDRFPAGKTHRTLPPQFVSSDQRWLLESAGLRFGQGGGDGSS